MNRNLQIAGIVLALLLLAACTAPYISSPTPDAGEPLAELIGQLRSAGATAEVTAETFTQPFFSVQARVVQVNGQGVQVFTFATPAAAEVEAGLVSPGGGAVGTHMISWMATPHFYKSGAYILLYVGDDTATVAALEAVAGPQFAGGAG